MIDAPAGAEPFLAHITRVSGMLAEASGAEVDRVGRILVEPDLTLPGHPDVLAIGDMVQIRGQDELPGVAPVAMQMGRYAARLVRNRLRSRETEPSVKTMSDFGLRPIL